MREALSPGITFRRSDSGWYRLEFDGRPISDENRELAILTLVGYIEEHNPPAATGPARDDGDQFRSAEDALAELRRGRTVYTLDEVECELFGDK